MCFKIQDRAEKGIMTQKNNDYKLLDSGNFQKLEQIGPYKIKRPCLQAIWSKSSPKSWSGIDFEFERTKEGQGKWKKNKKGLPSSWTIDIQGQKNLIKLTDFGHIGLFLEHHENTKRLSEVIAKTPADKPLRVLNLFAYTGFLSLFLARNKVQVVHLDASKKSIDWGKENLELSKIEPNYIRWITDDVLKFVAREKRRNSLYDGIILDPPSFGRGPKGELWKIDDHLIPLLEELKSILSKDFKFILLSSHSPGHTPIALKNVLSQVVDAPEKIDAFELTIQEHLSERLLPSGSCAYFKR